MEDLQVDSTIAHVMVNKACLITGKKIHNVADAAFVIYTRYLEYIHMHLENGTTMVPLSDDTINSFVNRYVKNFNIGASAYRPDEKPVGKKYRNRPMDNKRFKKVLLSTHRINAHLDVQYLHYMNIFEDNRLYDFDNKPLFNRLSQLKRIIEDPYTNEGMQVFEEIQKYETFRDKFDTEGNTSDEHDRVLQKKGFTLRTDIATSDFENISITEPMDDYVKSCLINSGGYLYDNDLGSMLLTLGRASLYDEQLAVRMQRIIERDHDNAPLNDKLEELIMYQTRIMKGCSMRKPFSRHFLSPHAYAMLSVMTEMVVDIPREIYETMSPNDIEGWHSFVKRNSADSLYILGLVICLFERDEFETHLNGKDLDPKSLLKGIINQNPLEGYALKMNCILKNILNLDKDSGKYALRIVHQLWSMYEPTDADFFDDNCKNDRYDDYEFFNTFWERKSY